MAFYTQFFVLTKIVEMISIMVVMRMPLNVLGLMNSEIVILKILELIVNLKDHHNRRWVEVANHRWITGLTGDHIPLEWSNWLSGVHDDIPSVDLKGL